MDNCCCGRPKSSWASPKGMRGKCERRGGSVNVAAEGANIIRREAKGYAGEGERGRGSVKAEGAGAEVFAGDGCSQGASFGPMALISRRGQGRRINNTRTREWLRRKCVKPADLTTHSPPKICSRPSRATRPSRTPPLPHAATMHARRPHDPFPTEDLRSPPHTSAPPRSPDAHPQAARCTPADLTTHSPPKACSRPRTTTRPPRALSHSLPAHFRSPAPRRCTPADLTTHSPSKICSHPRTTTRPSPALLPHPRSPDARPPTSPPIPRRSLSPVPAQRRPASPSVPLRAQKNGTAQCMCDAECFGRPSLRSVIWVGEPRAVRRRCGALACRRGA